MLKRTLLIIFCGFCSPVWAQNPVTIRVVDEGGTPVAGAQAEIVVWSDDKFSNLSASTDAAGVATLSLPKKPQEKLPAGRLTLNARGFAPVGALINRELFEFQLQKGAIWRGKVLDEAGKPIEGAKVAVNIAVAKGDAPSNYIVLEGKKLSQNFTDSSKTDGTFQIGDLPAGGKINFGVAQPRFAAGGGYSVPVVEEKTITLLPGASLRGRLLDDKGAPLPKTRVYAQSVGQGEGYGQAQSDDAGNFQIDSLATGNYNIIVELPDEAKFIVPAAANVGAQAGKIVEIAPLQGVTGVVVRGIVRDAVTKLPVAGARIGVQGPHSPETGFAVTSSPLTKADGRFEVRVVPGKNKFYLQQTPQNYISGNDQGQKRLEIGPAAPADLFFDLKPKTIVSGVIVDENGRPIQAQLKTLGSEIIQSDANGKWQWSPDSEGPFMLSGGEDETGYFELNEFLKIQLPIKAPLVVRVRKKPWQTLSGRIVGTDGTSIEGATVKGRFFVPIDEEGALSDSNRDALSDAQGRFVLPKIRVLKEGRELQISAGKAGYAFQSGGEVSRVGDKLSVSDFVFVPLNGAIEGMTSPSARVVAAGREVVADDTGKFKFEGLPAGETIVFAAKDGKFGQAVAVPDAPLQIGLQAQKTQGVDVEMGRQIWRDVVGDATAKNYYAAAWLSWKLSAPQADDVESLKRAALEPSTPDHDRQLAILIQKLAPRLQKDGQLSVIDTVLPAIATPEIRLTALLDAAIATGDKVLARSALDESVVVLATPSPDLMWRENNLYRIAVATEKLNSEAGLKALDKAINSTLANRPAKPFWKDGYLAEPGRDQWLQGEAETVALGSTVLLKRLLNAIDPEGGYQVRALANAIPIVAQTHGVEAALPLLEELRLLPKPTDKERSAPLNNEPEWAFGQTARRLIPLLGEKSPGRALELARRVTTKSHQVRALASAAKFQTGAGAADLWREVVQQADAGDAARFAASAWEFDPKLGAGLFEIARQKAAQGNQPGMRGGVWTTFAFYFARVDAAQSRLILEREWAKAEGNKGEGAQSIAMAMSAIDGRRADEMARQIVDKEFASPDARRKVGQYLQTSVELRRDFPFDRWSAGDTWEAGDPEW